MDDYFQWLMLLFVIITTIVRAVKGRKVKKVREQLAAVAPLINASVDDGRHSISGKVEGVPFKIKYEPEVENSPARLDLICEKRLPFNLEVAERITPFDPQQSSQAGEFLLDDRKFDEKFNVTTDDPEACREFLRDPLFHQGIELVNSEGWRIRFTRRRAVFARWDSEWLANTEQAAATFSRILQLGHSIIAEFE